MNILNYIYRHKNEIRYMGSNYFLGVYRKAGPHYLVTSVHGNQFYTKTLKDAKVLLHDIHLKVERA